MAENITNSAQETYQTNEATKQFTLLPVFEKFAQSKWLNEQAIKSVKAEIEARFASYNAENMDPRRFKNIKWIIESIITNEIGKAKSDLAEKSKALQGIRIATETSPAPEKIPANVPGITNTPKVAVGSILWAASWGYKNAIAARQQMLADAGK